jgi:hypothetical protein
VEVPDVDHVITGLAGQDYLADEGLATAVFLALRLQRPLFLEGDAGVGKTEVGKTLAAILDTGETLLTYVLAEEDMTDLFDEQLQALGETFPEFTFRVPPEPGATERTSPDSAPEEIPPTTAKSPSTKKPRGSSSFAFRWLCSALRSGTRSTSCSARTLKLSATGASKSLSIHVENRFSVSRFQSASAWPIPAAAGRGPGRGLGGAARGRAAPGGAGRRGGGRPAGSRAGFETYRVHYDEVDLKGAFHYTRADVRRAFEMLAFGVVDAAPLVTHRRGLAELPAALELALSREALKVAIEPQGA